MNWINITFVSVVFYVSETVAERCPWENIKDRHQKNPIEKHEKPIEEEVDCFDIFLVALDDSRKGLAEES